MPKIEEPRYDAAGNEINTPFPDPTLVPGVVRFDPEGNDHTYEHEVVTQYWLDHYLGEHLCVLCKNTGRVRIPERPFCICPNGQAWRWAYENKLTKESTQNEGENLI